MRSIIIFVVFGVLFSTAAKSEHTSNSDGYENVRELFIITPDPSCYSITITVTDTLCETDRSIENTADCNYIRTIKRGQYGSPTTQTFHGDRISTETITQCLKKAVSRHEYPEDFRKDFQSVINAQPPN